MREPSIQAVRHSGEPLLGPTHAYGMTSLTDSEQAAARVPAAPAAHLERDWPQGRAILRSLCLHASVLAALAVARIALPPLDALVPRHIEVTVTELPKKPIAPGTAEDPDSGSAAGTSGAAAAAPDEPAAAPAAAAAQPSQPVPPVPEMVERAKPVTPPKPPPPRPPKPVTAQAERVPKPLTAPVTQPKPLPMPLTAPAAPEATAPAPHALVAPTPSPPDTPPPPAVTRLLPPPPSVAAAPAPSLSSSPAGGSSVAGTGSGVSGNGPGAAAAGTGSGAGAGIGGPGRGSGRGDEYLAQLRRWILHYHEYPKGATGIGVATVGFQIAADGTVSHVTLERSSGDAIIDRDALSLLHRASPVPPPPPERLAAGHVEVAIPVEYEPGFFERLFR